jgi:hypothetical protein
VASIFAPLAFAGCPAVDDIDDGGNDNEVITRVALTFSPNGGGADVIAAFADPENDGNPTIDPITLTNGTTYTLTLSFENQLADPVEDITAEVADESDEHQVFVYGSAVEGPATGANPAHIVTHAYADQDSAGLPIGLENTVVAVTAGDGELKVMLRHMPPEDDIAVKAADIAAAFATDGDAIGGSVDVDVTFPLAVE